jgi:hypothetical protein
VRFGTYSSVRSCAVLKAKFKSKKTEVDTKDGGDKKPRIGDIVDLLKFPSKKWTKMRTTGPIVPYGGHWVDTIKKDGSKGRFWVQCLAFDSEIEGLDTTKECPWCDAQDKRINFRIDYYQNAIIRDLQEAEPKRKPDFTEKEEESRFKEKDSDSWTPIKVVRLTPSTVREMKRHAAENRHKSKKTGETKAWPLSHDHWGCDVKVFYDKDETPAKQYSVSINVEKNTPLSEEEQEYLRWNIEDIIKPDSLERARKEFERWLEKMGKKKKKDDDDEDDDSDNKKKKKSDDDDDDDEERSEKKSSRDDDDDDDTSSKKKKKSSDDEDDDSGSSWADDDDDEKPKKKKKSDDDDDDDKSSDDDDDDEPKKKKKASDDDDDDDDEPKKKKKKDDDDEEEGLDFDNDD